MNRPSPPTPEPLDLSERGAGGASSDRRLFMQLLVYTDAPADRAALTAALDASASPGAHGNVLYEAVNDPRGVCLLYTSDAADE